MSAKPTNTFKGDSFRNLVRQYSRDRMSRDPQYKRAVEKEMQRRREAKKREAAR
jgi:hypothetical protein